MSLIFYGLYYLQLCCNRIGYKKLAQLEIQDKGVQAIWSEKTLDMAIRELQFELA